MTIIESLLSHFIPHRLVFPPYDPDVGAGAIAWRAAPDLAHATHVAVATNVPQARDAIVPLARSGDGGATFEFRSLQLSVTECVVVVSWAGALVAAWGLSMG